MDFLLMNNHAFNQKHSTCTTIIANYLRHNVEEGRLTSAVFHHFKRAFDMVDIAHLIHKS